MKSYYKKKITPLFLLLLVLLSGCSEKNSSGSSITTGTAGSVSGNIVGSGTGSSNKITPDLVLESENPDEDPKTVSYTYTILNLLTEFNALNGDIETNYKLYLEYPNSEKSLEDYLGALARLEALLRTVVNLDPPTHLQELSTQFEVACYALAEAYKEVSRRMADGYEVQNTEELMDFEDFSAEILHISEQFSTTAFALIDALQ